MPGKGTTDAIFTVWHMQEIYGCKGKALLCFRRFGKAFDTVPREVTRWALRKALKSGGMVGEGSHGDV